MFANLTDDDDDDDVDVDMNTGLTDFEIGVLMKAQEEEAGAGAGAGAGEYGNRDLRPDGPGVVAISNVVSTALLVNTPSMQAVALHLNAQFNTTTFPAACRFRLDDPRYTEIDSNCV